MTAIVSVDRVGKRYGGVAVLDDVTLSLDQGEILALVGHNGAGKTTLMKLILGVIEPSSGSVRVAGIDPAGPLGAQARRDTGFLPESVAFPRTMTGYEIIAFYCRLKKEPTAGCMALLERVGLGVAAKQRVGTYSKGMRQRLGLAQALIGKPRLLLLDEPTTGLDPALRREFYLTLRTLRADGTAIVLSSHALAEIQSEADRFALIAHGRLLACDDLNGLLKQVAIPLRMALRVKACTTGRLLDDLGDRVEVEDRTPDRLVLRLRPEAKMEVLHRLVGLGELVRDIEFERPGLEALYRTLLSRSEQEDLP